MRGNRDAEAEAEAEAEADGDWSRNNVDVDVDVDEDGNCDIKCDIRRIRARIWGDSGKCRAIMGLRTSCSKVNPTNTN